MFYVNSPWIYLGQNGIRANYELLLSRPANFLGVNLRVECVHSRLLIFLSSPTDIIDENEVNDWIPPHKKSSIWRQAIQ